MNERVLVVDDEVSICELLKLDLEFEGYIVETANDGQEALQKVETFNPDIMILDLMLPKMNGYDVCKKVNADKGIPIIMLTAKTDIIDRVLGLELGADDYITKPFDSRELMARIKALLRRSQNTTPKDEDDILYNDEIKIIGNERKVLVNSTEIHLTPKEFELLHLLVSNPEQVFSRELLLERVWGYDYFGDTRTVDMHIQRIRKKIGEFAKHNYIQTVFGVGYKMRRF
ncbi:response regulator [Alkalibaculum sp. M08DMB]|uniref:Stage 0 sporulation protein A homolog n=1 Tax=Alkalibaculum sporogenes TaxID=2655001 RepID=A0A6A7KAP0_9FIRM|nr:response regulator transcription factor [Alkalibaculum sporogenes]MPW26351.1 response regulator [Alkalibaculum sporogenes]